MLRRHGVIAALSLLGVAAGGSSLPAQQSPVQVLVQRARLLDAQGRHDLAAEDWRQVLLIDPRQPEGLAALVSYYRSAGDSARATQYEAILSRIHPGAAFSVPKAAGSTADTTAMLREASRLAGSRDYAQALALYQRAFGSTQPPDDWAIAYYETEAAIPAARPHAVSGLRALASKYPANPSFQLALGRVLTYSAATRLEGVQILARTQGTAEQNEQARAAWRQAILWDPSSPAATGTGRQYLERYPDSDLASRLAAAPKHASAVKLASPLEGEGYRALASGDLSSAQERFTALAAQADRAAQGEAGLGYVAMKRRDFAAAAAHFEQARSAGLRSPALDKALTESRYWQAMSSGNAALASGETDRAAAEFEHARTLNKARPEATEALGGSLLAEKDAGDAVSVFAQDLKANPHRPDAWIGWMNAALESGRANDLLSAQTTMPGDVKAVLAHRPDYLALLAGAELATGNQPAAARLVERIQELSAGGTQQTSASEVRAAGMLLSLGYFDHSIQLCLAAIKSDAENAGAWQTLVEAEHAAGRDQIATQVATRMPKSVDTAAMANPDFLVALAAVYQREHQLTTASELLNRAAGLGTLSARTRSVLELQRAALALDGGDPHTAFNLYRQVQQQSPDKLEAWTGQVNALHAAKHDREALAMIENLSPAVSTKLRRDPAFLQTAASIYSENGRSREAMLCLNAVISHYIAQHQPVPFSVDSEAAWLLLNAGRDRELAATLQRLGSLPNLTDDQALTVKQIWTTWSIRRAEAEFGRGDGKGAVTLLKAAVQAYPDQLSARMALANMYARTGYPGLGVKMFLDMDWHGAGVEQFESAINAAVAGHNLNYAEFWLKLGLEQYPDNPNLLRAGARIEEQRGDLKKAMRYLATAKEGAAPQAQSLSTLEAELSGPGTKNAPGIDPDTLAPPQDQTPQGQLARMLGGTSSGLPIRSSESAWNSSQGETAGPAGLGYGLNAGVQPVSYALPGPASARPYEDPASDTRRKKAVQPGWPGDEAAPVEQPRSASQLPFTAPTQSADPWSQAPAQHSDDPLAGLGLDPDSSSNTNYGPDASTQVPGTASDPADALRAILGHTDAPVRQVGFAEGLEPNTRLGSSSADLTADLTVNHLLQTNPVMSSSQQKAADDLSELQSRYSPWFATGGVFKGHSGTSGFDQLHQYEAEIEGSTVIGNAARVTVITRPVSLQSGTPDPSSNFRFGSGAVTPTTTQFASGLGSEVQLATRSLQASFGYAPTNFPVKNMIGSFALRPAGGPFTVRLYRSNVKDTLLSYAGMTDPTTGKIWGGVVATGGALELNRGGGDSGFYASIGGEKLTGHNVADNTRIAGSAGAYWLALSNPFGRLKVGANLMAMHYALNERYFTFGQGGYFSPDSFLMLNAPLTWEGRPLHGAYYTVSGSLGTQNIQEGQAISGSLIAGTGVQTTTGASYDLHARVGHRVAEHWDVEGFLDTNNARQYAEHSAGFSVRYMKFPQPTDATPTGFLDQNSIRPLQRP